MREILFRGKTKRNDWVYGFYGKNSRGECLIIHDLLHVDGAEYNVDEYEVIPETVGQFIGLTDSNGNNIFEGDILKLTYDGYDFHCEVKFNDGAFLVYRYNGFNGGDSDIQVVGWLKYDDYTFEIIGNIHDNPEIIGKEVDYV